MILLLPISTLFPYTTLFRSVFLCHNRHQERTQVEERYLLPGPRLLDVSDQIMLVASRNFHKDRKSTRLNSSHQIISYAVFCLQKKTTTLCSSANLRSGAVCS